MEMSAAVFGFKHGSSSLLTGVESDRERNDSYRWAGVTDMVKWDRVVRLNFLSGLFKWFLILFYFFFKDRVSLCSPGWLEIQSVDQTGLTFTKFCLPLPLKCWDLRHVPSCPPSGSSLKRLSSPLPLLTDLFCYPCVPSFTGANTTLICSIGPMREEP